MSQSWRDEVWHALRSGKTRGIDQSCQHYPCHSLLEDCTWCFCPFYPCNNTSTGGRKIKGRI